MSEVVIENVFKAYRDNAGRENMVVENLNLTVRSEEFMVFVGPSGCGKSTTLRMIAGLEEISQGNIYIEGRRINDVAPKDRDIAMVFQNYALYPHMTVFKNMAFGLQLRNFPKDEINRRVRDAAQILGLSDDILDRKPKALSGGQRQRVALGRAIVRKPKVFLFDEPLSNLDAKMRVQMRTEISKLRTRLRTTMIYVTHDQVEAMTMGDRICIMKDGRFQQVAEPLEIYNQPANVFVAAFIGSPPMNFFEGVVRDEGGHHVFVEKKTDGQAEGVRLRVDESHVKALLPSLGKPIILGLRPEDLEHRSATAPADPAETFDAVLEVTEPMGAETHLYLNTGNHTFISRSHGVFRADIGHRMEFVARMSKAHFFELADRAPFKKGSGELDLEKWQVACRLIV